jgi:hypothetical protein
VVLLVFLLFSSSFFLFQTRRFALGWGGACEMNEGEVKGDKLISSFKSCLRWEGKFLQGFFMPTPEIDVCTNKMKENKDKQAV